MTLTVVSNPARGGDVTADPSLNPPLDNAATKNGTYYPTDNVIVTATPEPGYRFVNWTGDVAAIDDVNQSTIVVRMGKYFPSTQEVTLTANFEKGGNSPWWWLWGSLLVFLAVSLVVAAVVRRRKLGPDAEQL